MSEAFNPDYLRQHLRPLAAAEADAAVLAYQAYYGLDLRSRHPRLQARLGSMAVDGRRLAVQAWLLPEARGSLLLMHGYYDHMGLYRHVVDWALGMGFSVLACDLPGHGLSEGERASIRDFAEYQAVFKGLLGQAAELDLAAPGTSADKAPGGRSCWTTCCTAANVPSWARRFSWRRWCARAPGAGRSSATAC
ncbi:putative lysophospholipase [Pseudomonas aeruginosa PA38182]|nr:putative lysophospholipase [Pseudomonas aeruginosa PA38182]